MEFMCLAPITLRKKVIQIHGGTTNVVPCGSCVLCLKRRSNAWAFRLYEEMKVSTSAVFLTLTYDNEKVPISENGFATLNKRDYQLFMKSLRKALVKSNLKYYACGEYGTITHRPHYHAVLFNLPKSYIAFADKIANIWGKGHTLVAPCNMATIKYVCKYMMKSNKDDLTVVDYNTGEIKVEDDRQKEFSLMSKKMGLSHLTPAMKSHYKEKMINYITHPGGVISAMPRYFLDKLFDDDEKKIFNAAAIEMREARFEQVFAESYAKELYWKKDVIRRTKKQEQLKRMKV